MKKTTLLLITTLFYLGFLHAQTAKNTNKTPLTNEEFFTKSDLVIDGIYIGILAIYESQPNDTNIVLGYRVAEIYKGDQSLKWRTIGVICKKSKAFDDLFRIETKEASISIPNVLQRNGINSGYFFNITSILFFTKSDMPMIGIPERLASYSMYEFIQNEESRLYIFDDRIIGLNDLIFQNREELYNYMKQFEGYTVPEPPTSRPKKQPEEYDIHTLLKDSVYRMEVNKKMLENHRLVDSIRKDW